jgi:hypothetical protein
MPRPDVAKLYADHLERLPHPDGFDIRFLEYSRFGKPDDVRQRVNTRATHIGEALVNVAETAGYSFHHPNDPKPADTPGPKSTMLRCLSCGHELTPLPVNDQLESGITQHALATLLRTINPECPHDQT